MRTKEEISNQLNLLQLNNEYLKEQMKVLEQKNLELEKQIQLQNKVKELETEKIDKLRKLEEVFKKLQYHWIGIYPLKNKEGIERFGSLSKFKSEKDFTQGRMFGLQDGITIFKKPK